MTRGKEIKLGKQMVKAGYPYCYSVKGWRKHCEACVNAYKLEMKRLKKEKNAPNHN